jgi:hypothetical protein
MNALHINVILGTDRDGRFSEKVGSWLINRLDTRSDLLQNSYPRATNTTVRDTSLLSGEHEDSEQRDTGDDAKCGAPRMSDRDRARHLLPCD